MRIVDACGDLVRNVVVRLKGDGEEKWYRVVTFWWRRVFSEAGGGSDDRGMYEIVVAV